MSTNSTPIHMRLWTFAWRYSRECRQGLSRIAALGAAWAWVRTPVKITGGSIVVGGLTIRADGVTTIDRTTISANMNMGSRHGSGSIE